MPAHPNEDNVPRIRFGIREEQSPEESRRIAELNQQQYVRLNYAVPIFISITGDVPQNLANAAISGVLKAISHSKQERTVQLFNQPWGIGAHSSPEWYVKEAERRNSAPERNLGYGNQINARHLLDALVRDPYQSNPHWDILVFNKDLYSDVDRTNFQFGATYSGFPVCMQSVVRFANSNLSEHVKYLAVERLLAHEMGHMFGLVNREHHRERSLGGHCTNVCLMRQGLSLDEFVRQTVEEHTKGIDFCECCQSDLDTKSRSIMAL
jgi:predicted Zn-dependent protease